MVSDDELKRCFFLASEEIGAANMVTIGLISMTLKLLVMKSILTRDEIEQEIVALMERSARETVEELGAKAEVDLTEDDQINRRQARHMQGMADLLRNWVVRPDPIG